MIKFYRGLKANYNYNTGAKPHEDALYFATDTKELLMNGNAYGIPYTYDDSAIDSRLDIVEEAIGVLNGNSSTQGSVAYQIAQIVANADASFDTLKEIADWILNDTTGAAKMASDISDLQTAVGNIDYSGKADKVSGATTGNFAGLDANGNLTDSGKKASDFQVAGSYKTTQTAVSDPSASGNAAAFIDSISQDANGAITVTKKNVQAASGSQAGLESSAHYTKVEGIESGAQVNVIEKIKVGNTEQTITSKTVTLGTAAGAATTDFDAAGTAAGLIAGLDAEKSQTAGADGLALSITEVDGKITAISGSIAAETYDAYGAAATAESNAKTYAEGLLAWIEVSGS